MKAGEAPRRPPRSTSAFSNPMIASTGATDALQSAFRAAALVLGVRFSNHWRLPILILFVILLVIVVVVIIGIARRKSQE
jgi:hypothetical protein